MKRAIVGNLVRLKGKKRSARVTNVMSDVPGGVVLDRRLSGFYCWNVEDLERGFRRHYQPRAQRT